MFVHFDLRRNSRCDDCGNPISFVHVFASQTPRGLNLCVACFRALTLAMVQASQKLRVASSPEKLVPAGPSMVPE
jgi:hypothetical protein